MKILIYIILIITDWLSYQVPNNSYWEIHFTVSDYITFSVLLIYFCFHKNSKRCKNTSVLHLFWTM